MSLLWSNSELKPYLVVAAGRARDPPEEAPHRAGLLLEEGVEELHRVLLALVPREWTRC